MPFDQLPTMSTLGGAGATPGGGTNTATTVLRGPVDRDGEQPGGPGNTNFRNG